MRTVPVGSGQNKGWVSSDHYMHIKSENTNNYNDSSAKILSFDSSGDESLVTENVTSSVSRPWPYQYPHIPTFYHIPVYWGCTAELNDEGDNIELIDEDDKAHVNKLNLNISQAIVEPKPPNYLAVALACEREKKKEMERRRSHSSHEKALRRKRMGEIERKENQGENTAV
ncbi:hypothetical protein Bca101_070855 [Brassica carinata]